MKYTILLAAALLSAAGVFAQNPVQSTKSTEEVETVNNLSEIKHGTIKTLKMPCKLLKGVTEREFTIYLPPEYESEPDAKYPVFYLMHGGGGSNVDFKAISNINNLADRMIYEKRAPKMIIVTPEGNKNNMMYFNSPDWKYEDFFFKELIPYIEKNYRARTDKGGRAIGGFSMGGGAAVVYGVKHSDKFSLVYDISGYLRRQELDFLKGDPSAEWRQRVIEENNPIKAVLNGNSQQVKRWRNIQWVITVGDHDFTLEANMDFVKALREKEIPYSMRVNTGMHDWNYVTPELEKALEKLLEVF